MSDLILKCSVCRALLDEEDDFCVNCGTEAPRTTELGHIRHTQLSTYNFTCENCGASMSYDASVKNLRCPFCSSEKMHPEQDAKTLAPDYVVPFSVPKDKALAQLQTFMGASFWRPDDLRQASQVTKLIPVYVPYWVFSATTHTHWTADSSQTPPGARAAWYPVGGSRAAHYDGVLIGASGSLTPAETHALCPFDLAAGVPADQVDLENATYEPFRVQKKYARPQAIAGFEELEREACRREVPGSSRNVRVAVRLEGLASYPVLLPVWIMAYQYRGQTFRFLVNGQTGRSSGHAPFSYHKLGLVVFGSILAALLLVFLFALCAGIAGSR